MILSWPITFIPGPALGFGGRNSTVDLSFCPELDTFALRDRLLMDWLEAGWLASRLEA
jgi:hypothetical protein